MRELTIEELALVAGGESLVCTPEDGNNYGGISDTSSLGDDLINMYEGVVAFASHVIERVANAL